MTNVIFSDKLCSLSLLVLVSALCGCSRQSFSTAEVTGKVTLDGAPVAGVSLEFEPGRVGKEILPTGYGSTDAEGAYRVTRVGNKPGAVVGKNLVRVTTYEGSVSKIHPHYSTDEGAFQFEVKEGQNVFNVELVKNPLQKKK